MRRIERRQPLAAPRNVRRYFISLAEAGSLCVLASGIAPAGQFLVPRLDPTRNLRTLEEVAVAFLAHHGFEPAVYDDPEKAKGAVAADVGRRRYPLLLTPPDTDGEKPFEEFVEK